MVPRREHGANCHGQTSQAFLGTVSPCSAGRPAGMSKNWGQARLPQVPACPGSAARRLGVADAWDSVADHPPPS